MQTTRCSHRLLWVKCPPFPIIPNRDSNYLARNPGPTRMVAAISKKVKQFLGQGATTPARATLNLIVPNGAGITNTIGRSELVALGAAIAHDRIHVATDNLTSLHQTRKHLLYPEKHRLHVQEETSSKCFLVLSSNPILNPTSSFIK